MLNKDINKLYKERRRLLTLLLLYRHDEREEKEFIKLISKINSKLSKFTKNIKVKNDYVFELLISKLIKSPTQEIKDKLKNELTKYAI